jgi:hypothetical protein
LTAGGGHATRPTADHEVRDRDESSRRVGRAWVRMHLQTHRPTANDRIRAPESRRHDGHFGDGIAIIRSSMFFVIRWIRGSLRLKSMRGGF